MKASSECFYAAETLRAFATEMLTAAGAPEPEACCVAEQLVDANLCGRDSHGVRLLPKYLSWMTETNDIIPGAAVEIERETATTALLNGHWNFGQVIADRAVTLALQKAAASDVGLVWAHHSGHVGYLGGYVARIADAGMVGLAACNSNGTAQTVAPWGGTRPRLASNPIAFAAPRGGRPHVVVDLSTATWPEGRIALARDRGETLPQGVLLDGDGRPTTNPADLYSPRPGALLPFGGIAGHKGFALGVLVEALVGGFSALGCCRPEPSHRGNALFVQAIRIEAITPLADFTRRLETFVAHVHDTPVAPGHATVRLPGEPSARTRQERAERGIPLDEETRNQLASWSKRLRVAEPVC